MISSSKDIRQALYNELDSVITINGDPVRVVSAIQNYDKLVIRLSQISQLYGSSKDQDGKDGTFLVEVIQATNYNAASWLSVDAVESSVLQILNDKKFNIEDHENVAVWLESSNELEEQAENNQYILRKLIRFNYKIYEQIQVNEGFDYTFNYQLG